VQNLSVDPKNAEAVQARKAQIAELTARSTARGPGEGAFTAGLKVELIPLTEEVKPDPNATELLTAYYAQLRSMNAKKGDQQLCQLPPGSTEQRYVGSAACRPCHAPAYDFWTKTKHGRAWATLEDQGKHFDLTCIGCHSVGYQKPGGYCRLDDIGVLKDVGCEMCHGPGSLHAVTGDKKQTQRTVTEATCAGSCHVPAHSDTFAFKPYLARITGEGHRLGSPP
jgi:hypothetical protein